MQIVALGGGGFSEDAEDQRLDDFILSLSSNPRPKVCLLPTASGDATGYIVNFYERLGRRCQPSHLRLQERPEDPRGLLMDQDVIYVGGGSTPNMLAIWHVHGLDHVLHEAWEAGVILCGISAGSLCWFEAGVTDSLGRTLQPFNDGLGLLPGSHCPHYDNEPERRPAYHRFVAQGLPGGLGADSGVGLHFVGTELVKVVTTRTVASAYRVELLNGQVVETRLPAELL
jgi:dipeptidase E